VVACRNELRHIRAFTESLLAQDLREFDWEVIFADGMSDDGTREYLSDFARGNSHITVIDNSFRIVATGLNAAIRAARGEIILRMDTHSEYACDYVRKCVETLEATDACNVGGPARTKAEGLCSRAIQAAYHSRFSSGGARFHDELYSGYVDTVPYGCWRKETLIRLGLFDEQLVRNQDDELNLRLIRAGGKIWQSSDIVSWYHPRPTLSLLFLQYFQYGFWKVLVIRKHRQPASWRHLIPGAFVLLNLILFFTVVTTLVIGQWLTLETTAKVWILLLLSYAFACLVSSAFSAQNYGWQLLPYLPATFAVYHMSYGLGFLFGLIYWPFARQEHPQLGKLFKGDTR
jgi:succinoglycan biosynthesis protein ExoA